MTIPPRPPLHQLLQPISILTGDHLVVPIGVSHISFWLQEIQSREWEKKKEQMNNKAWVNSTARRLSCDTAFPVACISSENSTNHEECWLILTGSSLLLDPISCRLVSSVVRYRLPTATLRLPPRTAFSAFLFPTPTRVPLPTSGRVKISSPKPFVCFRA